MIPSPTMSTTAPFALAFRTSSVLPEGVREERTLPIPAFPAISADTASPSPVTIARSYPARNNFV